MELAVPHIVVWTHGTGLGTDLVAALATHPVAVSEVRGLTEARRAASGPPQMLVVLVSPFDIPVRTAEAMLLFPGVAMLLVADTAAPPALNAAHSNTQVEVIPTCPDGGQSLPRPRHSDGGRIHPHRRATRATCCRRHRPVSGGTLRDAQPPD